MDRRTLLTLAVVALVLGVALWNLKGRSRLDGGIARQGHTWVEGQREPLADTPEADAGEEALVAGDQPDDGEARSRASEPRAESPTPLVGDAPQARLAAPGLVHTVDVRRSPGRLEVSLRANQRQRDAFPVVASLVCRRAFGDEPVRATDSWPNPRFVFEDLAGDVELVLTCTDAAPIEIAFGNAALSRTIAIDLDELMRPLHVEVHTSVALVRDALASARAYASAAPSGQGADDGADAQPVLADGYPRELWLGLSDGRATAHAAVHVDTLESWLEPQAWVLAGVLHVPFADGGDSYAGDGLAIVVGRDWSRASLVLASGVPHALVARRVERPVALRPPEGVEVAAFELVPKDAVLVPRPGDALAHEMVFELTGAAAQDARYLEFTAYGGAAQQGEPAFEQHLLPVRFEGGRALARLALDPFALVPLPRAMLRVPGHAPHFFDLPEALAAGALAVDLVPGDGGVVLGGPATRWTEVPPVAHLDAAWSGRRARFDPLGYAEFAAPSGLGGSAASGSDVPVFAAALVAPLDPSPRARAMGLPTAIGEAKTRDIAAGVVLLEVTRR
jgi:hypothetical protein